MRKQNECLMINKRCILTGFPHCFQMYRNRILYIWHVRTTVKLAHGSRFTVNDSQFTVHDSRFVVHCSQFTIRSSRFTIHGSRFAVHGLRFKVHDLQ